MDARTKIAAIASKAVLMLIHDHDAEDIAGAILAALPDILRADPSILRGMVKPLVWVNSYGVLRSTTLNGDYKVCGRILTLPLPMNPQQTHQDEEAAQSAANAHHVATTLQTLGVTV